MSETLAPTHAIIGSSPALREALDVARALARGTTPIMIVAEKGLETTELAEFIHAQSGRQGSFHRLFAPRVADPDKLSELAGGLHTQALVHSVLHEIIERAQGGTLFIDEIGELPLFGQGILEDLLTQQARGTPGADVRVVASSSVDLVLEASEKRFREGLVARLLFAHVVVPPLRRREVEDVLALARHLLQTHPYLVGCDHGGLTRGAEPALLRHRWQGNLTELEAVLVRAVRLAGEAPIAAPHIEAAIANVIDTFQSLWAKDHEPGSGPPGMGLIRDLEPDPEQEARCLATEELAVRVFGKEILAPSNAEMKEHGLTVLTIALRRVLARFEEESAVLHERNLREVTLLRGKQGPRLMEALVEDGVLALAPDVRSKRVWRRARVA